MASGNVARVLRAPGTVYINPTNLGEDAPNYGTEIGKTNVVAMQTLGTQFRVWSEGYGEATDILEANHEVVVSMFVRGWDDDAVELLLPDGYELGATSGHATFAIPGSAVPGASALARAVSVLYIPDDVLQVPALLVYRGVPDWTEGAELAFQRGSELGLPISFDCLRDGNDNILRIGRLADLSLT